MWIFIHCKDLWWIHRFWLRLKYLFIENCLLKLTCLNFGAIVVNFLYVVLHAFLFVEAVFYFVWIRHIDSTSSWCGGCILKTFNFSFFKFSWKFKTYLLSTTVELLLRIGISIFINFKNFTILNIVPFKRIYLFFAIFEEVQTTLVLLLEYVMSLFAHVQNIEFSHEWHDEMKTWRH